jgi:hypothetical protein
MQMGTNPFLKSPFGRKGAVNRRRSTRLECTVPIILSGRDAAGANFRESTHTVIVNLHGAKLKTSRQILVGMQVVIENPRRGTSEKAVCVRIEEEIPEEDARFIAVQLVRPGNIWGVTDPPADWSVVAAHMIGPSGERQEKPASPAVAALPDSSAPIIESQAVTWEQQSTELVESAVQILRRQIEVLLSASLQQFETRLTQLEKDAEERLDLKTGKSLTEMTNLIKSMREEISAQISSHGSLVMKEAERDLRAKVAEILSPLATVTANLLPNASGTFTRK